MQRLFRKDIVYPNLGTPGERNRGERAASQPRIRTAPAVKMRCDAIDCIERQGFPYPADSSNPRDAVATWQSLKPYDLYLNARDGGRDRQNRPRSISVGYTLQELINCPPLASVIFSPPPVPVVTGAILFRPRHYLPF